jgi:ubiquinone/menaquinone biosynthesis C-methylase UbiE
VERIPEPDLMNEASQALAYAEADFSEPHDAFVEAFRNCFPDFKSGRVLDLGCGPADISCRFANAYPDSEVIGIDGANEMLKLGEQRIQQQKLNQRVSLHKVYLPDDPIPYSGQYDAIISNSLLHHLSEPMHLWQTIRQQAKTNQVVFVMDQLRPNTKELAQRLVSQYAEGEPEVLQRDFYHSLCAAYQPDEIQQQLQKAQINLEIQVISDRHQIISGMICD